MNLSLQYILPMITKHNTDTMFPWFKVLFQGLQQVSRDLVIKFQVLLCTLTILVNNLGIREKFPGSVAAQKVLDKHSN